MRLFAHYPPFLTLLLLYQFHYYPVTSFVHPDKDWPEDLKTRFRKCKHVLVSLDQVEEAMSQADYRKQVTTFVEHLVKLLNDSTFPIWFFTVNEPPMLASTCHSPAMPRTTDHPCNDVLKDLFRPEAKTFPAQVHLLDNTDMLRPQFDENRQDILALIALRVFVFVGYQVEQWRNDGQVGRQEGLHRGGKVEPNFDLVPYEGWKQ
jgi:hypothetical protein